MANIFYLSTNSYYMSSKLIFHKVRFNDENMILFQEGINVTKMNVKQVYHIIL